MPLRSATSPIMFTCPLSYIHFDAIPDLQLCLSLFAHGSQKRFGRCEVGYTCSVHKHLPVQSRDLPSLSRRAIHREYRESVMRRLLVRRRAQRAFLSHADSIIRIGGGSLEEKTTRWPDVFYIGHSQASLRSECK
jgi:hypothetical protein